MKTICANCKPIKDEDTGEVVFICIRKCLLRTK